jgi:predicted enzyme related to lactoylglutathione lyase
VHPDEVVSADGRGRCDDGLMDNPLIKGLAWLGVRTERYEELLEFLQEGMGLTIDHETEEFSAFKLPDGSTVEVFGPSDQNHRHFTTGPVAGFLVDDIEEARRRLEAAGAEFIDPIQRMEETGEAWTHFRAPDGNVYEVTYRPS